MTELLVGRSGLIELDGPDVVDWSALVDRPFVPVARRRLVARPSKLTDVVTAVHGAHHAAIAMLADAVVVGAAAAVIGDREPMLRFGFPLAFFAAAYLAQVYQARDSVQT